MNNNIGILTTAGAVILTIVNIIYNRIQSKGFKYRLNKEQNLDYLTAQSAYQTTMITTAKEIAQSSYQLVDRLKTDLEELRKNSASKELAASIEINNLQTQIISMKIEIENLRNKVAQCVCRLGELDESRS